MKTIASECKRFLGTMKQPLDWEVAYHAGAMMMMLLMSEVAQNVPEDEQSEVLDRFAEELGRFAVGHFPHLLDENGDLKSEFENHPCNPDKSDASPS